MMKATIIQLIFSCLMLSCSNINRDKPVDKANLTGDDYRLFQNTPAWELAKAVQDEDINEIERITSEDPELINYQEPKYGNTLLKLTVMNQQLKSFKALLERKADVSIHNTFDGTSAIIEACGSKHYDIVFAQMLVEYGANVNDVETGERRQGNSTRETPLMAAAKTGKLDLVKFLVSKGADINYQNEFGGSIAKQVGNLHEENAFAAAGHNFKVSFGTLAEADQTIDLMNNEIGRKIGEETKGQDMQFRALATLDYYRKNGLWTATPSTDKNGKITGFSISQTKLSQAQYDAAKKTIQGLNANGFTSSEQSARDDTAKQAEKIKAEFRREPIY